MPRQLSFAELKKPGASFGGSLLKGNPKTKRPLASKLPIHLTLRATKSGMRRPGLFGQVEHIVYETARKHGVRIYEYANVGNHLHVLLKLHRVSVWSKFIRELAGRIALLMRKALTLSKNEDFWLFRPHTRVVSGGRKAFQTAKAYVHLNWLEGEGFIKRKETKTLRDLSQIWAALGQTTPAWHLPTQKSMAYLQEIKRFIF